LLITSTFNPAPAGIKQPGTGNNPDMMKKMLNCCPNRPVVLVSLIMQVLILEISLYALIASNNPAYLLAFVISIIGALYAGFNLTEQTPPVSQDNSTHYHFIVIPEQKLYPLDDAFRFRW